MSNDSNDNDNSIKSRLARLERAAHEQAVSQERLESVERQVENLDLRVERVGIETDKRLQALEARSDWETLSIGAKFGVGVAMVATAIVGTAAAFGAASRVHDILRGEDGVKRDHELSRLFAMSETPILYKVDSGAIFDPKASTKADGSGEVAAAIGGLAVGTVVGSTMN